jgi:hypothetical protein
MKKKQVLMMSLLALLGLLCACSNDDENDDNESAQALLIGKWRLVYNMEQEPDPSTDFVEFCENGTVIFEHGVGTDDYRYEESQFVFENDWHYSEPGIVWNIYGHFQLKSGGAHDEFQKYYCCIENGRLHFGLVGDGNSTSTTPFYLRVQ